MEWHGVTCQGIGLNYTYKEILNALKTKGRCKYTPLLVCSHNTHLTFHAQYRYNVFSVRQAFRGLHNRFAVLKQDHTQSFSTGIHLNCSICIGVKVGH